MKYNRWILVMNCIVLAAAILQVGSTTYAQQAQEIVEVRWSPDGSKIAEAGTSGLLRIWDVVAKRPTAEISTLSQGIDSIAWNPDGTRIASVGARDGAIRIWDVGDGKLVTALETDKDALGRALVSWSPDGRRIASVLISESAPIRIWNAQNDNNTLPVSTFPSSFYAMLWSPDSSKLFVANFVGSYIVSDLSSDSPKFRQIGPFTMTAAWNPSGTTIAIGCSDGEICLLDSETGQTLTSLKANQRSIIALTWNSDGTRLVSIDSSDTIQVWDMVAFKTLEIFPKEETSIVGTTATWSPYGGQLVYLGKVLDSAANRTQSLGKDGLQVVVPAPSLDELRTITLRCAKADVQKQLTPLIDTTKLPNFVSTVKALRAEQILPACAADLVAVAQALQAKS